MIDGVIGSLAPAAQLDHREADIARGDGRDVSGAGGFHGQFDGRFRQIVPRAFDEIGWSAERRDHFGKHLRRRSARQSTRGAGKPVPVRRGNAGRDQHLGGERQGHLFQPAVTGLPG
jgi:hypothetical protein